MKNTKNPFYKTLFFVSTIGLAMFLSLFIKAQSASDPLIIDPLNANTGLEARVSPITAPVRTSAALKESVNLLLNGVVNATEADFCTVLDASFLALPPEAKETLAWKKESYSANVNLEVGNEVSSEVKEKIMSLKDSYTKVNDAIGEAVSAETPVSVRAATAIRSAYLELMGEYRGTKPDESRITKLQDFIDKVKTCIGTDDKAKNLGSIISTSLGGGTMAETVLEVKRSDISQDEEIKTNIEVKDVSSRTTLEQFAKAKISKDDKVVSITTDSSQTETIYKVRGKLFGFIPANMKVRAALASGGTVTIKYPWFSFLVRKGTKITSETILETLGEDASVKFAGDLSSGKQAEAISLLLSAFEPKDEPETKDEPSENSDTEI